MAVGEQRPTYFAEAPDRREHDATQRTFLKIGGFDQLVSSGEDTDLHNRLTYIDAPVLIDHVLDVTHLGNAKTPFQFLQRQIWHSENYLSNLARSLKDPVFLATLIFLIFPFVVAIKIFLLPNKTTALITLILWILAPALLSLKRLLRAGHFTIRPKDLVQIYFLDFLYLTGRSLGILKGFVRRLNRQQK